MYCVYISRISLYALARCVLLDPRPEVSIYRPSTVDKFG